MFGDRRGYYPLYKRRAANAKASTDAQVLK
jgi:hypothetical protein